MRGQQIKEGKVIGHHAGRPAPERRLHGQKLYLAPGSVLLACAALVWILVLTGCHSGVKPGVKHQTMADGGADVPLLSPLASVARGEYMVNLLGCAACHSDGVLVGAPVPGRHLAGSSVGIAWSLPGDDRRPGVIYPPNLTPDPTTGIGGRSVARIVAKLRGAEGISRSHLPVMPWPAYQQLTDEDAESVALYLQSLPPVLHKVPAPVLPGQAALHPYVHFGVLQWSGQSQDYQQIR